MNQRDFILSLIYLITVRLILSDAQYYSCSGYGLSLYYGQCECEAGYYEVSVNSLGDKTCSLCPVNTYSNSYGSTSCTSCESGGYTLGEGSTYCLSTSYYSSTSCTGVGQTNYYGSCSCEAGYALSESADKNITCTICPIGTYSNFVGSTECTSCNLGYTTYYEGSTYCEYNYYYYSTCIGEGLVDYYGYCECEPGYKQTGNGRNATCTICPINTYAPTYGSTVCYSCGAGEYTDGEGSTYCNYNIDYYEACTGEGQEYFYGYCACKPGYKQTGFGKNAVCTKCPINSYSDAYESFMCTNCTSNSYTDDVGSTTCNCTAGKSLTFYRRIGEGLVYEAYSNTCSCDYGYKQTGYGSNAKCTICPINTYSDYIGSTYCSNCSYGGYTFGEGSTYCYYDNYYRTCSGDGLVYYNGECTCGPGYKQVGYGDYTYCVLCPINTYSSYYGSSNCNNCTNGGFTYGEGSTYCDYYQTCSGVGLISEYGSCYCQAGYKQSGYGSSANCTICPVNTYSYFGSTECYNCSYGGYTNGEGSTYCNYNYEGCTGEGLVYYFGSCSCDAGFQEIRNGSSVSCKLCPINTFSSYIGSTECSNCSYGGYTYGEGSTYCFYNYYQNCTGKGLVNYYESCACEPGYKQSGYGENATCTICPINTYTDYYGSTECNDCYNGYNYEEGSTTCYYDYNITCSGEGLVYYYDTCTCEPGYQQIRYGEYPECSPCPINTYSDYTGAPQCFECGIGGYTDGEGSSYCSYYNSYSNLSCNAIGLENYYGICACQPGYKQIGYGENATCQACQRNTYSDTYGSMECTSCGNFGYTYSVGSQDCVYTRNDKLSCTGNGEVSISGSCVCDMGYYTNTTTGSCIKCPINTANPTVNSTSCIPCYSIGDHTYGAGAFICQNYEIVPVLLSDYSYITYIPSDSRLYVNEYSISKSKQIILKYLNNGDYCAYAVYVTDIPFWCAGIYTENPGYAYINPNGNFEFFDGDGNIYYSSNFSSPFTNGYAMLTDFGEVSVHAYYEGSINIDIFSNNILNKSCPSYSYFEDGSCQCEASNTTFIALVNKCMCNPGFKNIGSVTHSICEICPEGTFSSVFDSPNCQTCDYGYNSIAGSEKCNYIDDECSGTGRIETSDGCGCSIGYYIENDSCNECPIGTANPTVFSGTCTNCTAIGKRADSPGSYICQNEEIIPVILTNYSYVTYFNGGSKLYVNQFIISDSKQIIIKYLNSGDLCAYGLFVSTVPYYCSGVKSSNPNYVYMNPNGDVEFYNTEGKLYHSSKSNSSNYKSATLQLNNSGEIGLFVNDRTLQIYSNYLRYDCPDKAYPIGHLGSCQCLSSNTTYIALVNKCMCNPGYHNIGELNNPICKPCIAGTYSVAFDSTSCSACPTGYSSVIGSQTCVVNTISPTISPTNVPTIPPTTSPTSTKANKFPTGQPTSQPSDLFTNYETLTIYKNYLKINNLVKSANNEIFKSFYYKGDFINGSCSSWSTYTAQSLSLPFKNQYFSKLTAYYAVDSLSGSNTNNTFSCSDKTIISGITNGLQSVSTYTGICNSNEWKVKICNSKPILCVNCDSGCGEVSTCQSSTSVGFTISPCQACTYHKASYSILSAAISNAILYPKITLPISLAVTSTVITATVNITKAGTVYCAAVLNGYNVSSSFYVKQIGSSAAITTTAGGVASISISGLIPVTNYTVYCYTEDFQGDSMPLSSVLATATSISTECCRSITLTTYSTKMKQYDSSSSTISPTTFTFTIGIVPTSTVTITISATPFYSACGYNISGTTSSLTISPSTFTYSSTSLSVLGNFIISKSTPGCYSLVLSSSSPVYQSTSNINLYVYGSSIAPPAPILSSAIFSNDGTKIFIYFDSNTNYAADILTSTGGSFQCSLIVTIVGLSTSTCQWASSGSQIIVSLSSTATVLIGNSVNVVSKTIKAACPTGVTCTTYSSSAILVTILAPTNPITPTVSLSTPTSLSKCDNIVIDPTFSSGFAGRSWSSVVWSVSSSTVASINITAIATYLNTNYQSTNKLVTVPNSYLPIGSYTISLQLTNFLLKSAVAAVTTTLQNSNSVPQVSISGPSVVTMYRNQTLSLFAVASVPSCGSSTSSVGLKYSWAIYRGTTLLSLSSVSNDPRYFTLNSYTLDTSTTYTVKVTVSTTGTTSGSSSASTSVQVSQSSGVVATIRGGTSITLTKSIGSTLVDASDSYNIDYPTTTSSSFTCDWACIDHTPTNFGNACSFGNLDSTKSAQITLDLSSIAISSLGYNLYQVAVLVTDPTTGLTSFTWTIVTVKADPIPIIAFGSISTKYNPTENIVLTGEVSLISGNATAYWSSSTLTSFSQNLSSYIITPLEYTNLPNGYTNIVQIALSANTLTPGSTYIFELVSAYKFSPTITASCQVSIVVNSPPRNGLLEVSPINGTAANTTYDLKTYGWIDDVSDYPFTYAMIYYTNPSDTSSRNTIKTASQVTYISTTLGQGLELNDYNVSCTVIVYDSYNGSATDTTYIQIYPNSQSNADLVSSLNNTLVNAFLINNVNLVTVGINSILSQSNAVVCSGLSKTYCSSINRLQCSQVDNTCGECVDGYIGPIGNSNNPCHLESSAYPIGSSCTTNNQCISNYCNDKICNYNNKPCPSDCYSSNSQGTCKYFDLSNSSLEYDSCLEIDTYCLSKCVCRTGYNGDDCSLSNSDFSNLQSIRELMCLNLYNSISLQDFNIDSVISISTVISNVLQYPQQMTSYALQLCLTSFIDTINGYPTIAGHPTTLDFIVNTLNTALCIPSVATVSSLINVDSSLLNDITSVLSVLSGGIQDNKAIGESSTSQAKSCYRFTTSLSDPCTSSTVSNNIPQTSYESFNNKTASAFSANTGSSCGTSNGVGISASQILTSSNDSSKIVGTVVNIKSNDYSVSAYGSRRRLTSSSSYEYTLTLANSKSVTYSSEVISGNVTCEQTNPIKAYNITLNCTQSTEQYVIICPGSDKRIIEYQCPGDVTYPQCKSSSNGYTFSDDSNCEVVSYNKDQTICKCTTTTSSSRRLSLNQVSQSENKQFSSSTSIVTKDFTKNIKSITKLNSSTITKNLVIFITMIVIVGVTLLGVVNFVRIDLYEVKTKPNIILKQKKKIASKVYNFFNSLLPIEFTGQPWFIRFIQRVKLEHDWFCLVLPFSTGRDYRSVRWVRAMGRVLHMLFIDTILAGLFFSDDGTCEGYTTKSSCLSTKSLDQIDTLCLWSSSSDSCSFNGNIGSSTIATLTITTIITIVTIPFDAFFYFILLECKKLVENNVKSLQVAEEVGNDIDLSKGLKNLQTAKSKFFKAVRLIKLQNNYKLSIDNEIKYILENNRTLKIEKGVDDMVDVALNKTTLPSTVQNDSGIVAIVDNAFKNASDLIDEPADPLTVAKLISMVTDSPNGPININIKLLRKKLVEARKQSEVITSTLERIDDNNTKDIYLIQQFLVHCLSGLKRKIAYRYFFKDIERKVNSKGNPILQYCCLIILPLYLIFLALYVFLFGVSIGSKATNAWLLGSFVSLLQSIFILQPVKIWLQYVAISAASDEVRIWHGLLREKAKIIMSRASGMIIEKNVLIQHINPACRAAASYPYLPSSRLIMAIHDYDLPTSKIISSLSKRTTLKRISKYAFFMVVIFLFLLTLLPDFLQDSMYEGLSTPFIGVVVLVLAFLGRDSIIIPLAIVGGMLAIFIAVEAYRDYIRKHSKQIVKPVQLPQDDLLDDDIYSDKSERKAVVEMTGSKKRKSNIRVVQVGVES